MIRVPRYLVSLVAGAFALFNFFLGVLALSAYKNEANAVVALVIYLISVSATVVFYRGIKLPVAQALFNLAAAALVPLLVNNELDPSQMNDYSTWYVVAIGTLMAATAVRQQPLLAWLGVAVLLVELLTWGGPGVLFVSGIIGAVLLVSAGHAVSLGLVTASKQAAEFNELALRTETEQAVASAASRERQSRIAKALAGALPALQAIRAARGKLSPEARQEAILLEASLRDEIRGRNLMNPTIRDLARQLRLRGVEVMILDEGSLDSVTSSERDRILGQAAGALRSVTEGRVTIRSPQGEDWLVTVVAVRPGNTAPDIWLKLG